MAEKPTTKPTSSFKAGNPRHAGEPVIYTSEPGGPGDPYRTATPRIRAARRVRSVRRGR